MPKHTDTFEKVQLAADELLSRGLRPTQQAIRELIGQGSITTINKALNIWWSTLSKRLSGHSEHPTLPDPVITAASKLWDQALVYSQALLEKQQLNIESELEKSNQNNNQKVIELQERCFSVQQQNNRLLNNNESLLAEKQVLAQKIYELESLLIKRNAEKDELNRQDKQTRIILDKQLATPQDQSTVLFQAKVDLKVNEAIMVDLRSALTKSEKRCQKLQQEVLDLEKVSLKQIHRLELVIAQQDVKYDIVREQLASFQENGR